MPQRDLLKPAEHKLIEDQANRFASAFLMPAAAITRASTSLTLEGLKSLKRQWGTSMQAIVMRLHGLDVISEELKTRFFRAFSARGWRKAEPYDDVIPLERPELLRQAIETLLNHHILIPREILDAFPYGARDIEELCSLPEGLLAVYERAGQIRTESVEKPRVTADVIPFRSRWPS